MTLRQKMAGYVRRLLSLDDTAGWPIEQGHAGELVSESSVLALSAVWACVNLLSGTIASLPLMVYRLDGAARRVARDHPLYRVLHDSPNADQTAVDFWDFKGASIELWGNAYSRIERSSRGVSALLPIKPDAMTVTRLASGALQYRWTENGKSFERGEGDMLHIRGFGGSPLGGMSTLQFGRNAFSLAQAIDKSAGHTFANGMRPAGVLTMPTVMKKDQREDVEKGLQAKFAGAVNAGRPMVLEGGVTWQQLSLNPEDAQMLQSRGFSIEEVCRFFGVPPFMVGHTEKTTSWGTGLEQQILGFQKFTLRRRLKRIEQALEKQLLSSEDRAAGVSIEFNLEGLLRGDSKARAEFYRQMSSIGAMTINEIRALENLPPVEGGDVPRMQMQNVPITQAGQIEPPEPSV